jgi:hypothetical protein
MRNVSWMGLGGGGEKEGLWGKLAGEENTFGLNILSDRKAYLTSLYIMCRKE